MEVNYAESKLYTMKPCSTGVNGSKERIQDLPGLVAWLRGVSTWSEVEGDTLDPSQEFMIKFVSILAQRKSGFLWLVIGQIRVLPYAFLAVCFGFIGSLPRIV